MAQSFKVSFTLDEEDTTYFRNVFRMARKAAANEDKAKILRPAKRLVEKVRKDIQYKAIMDFWLYIHVPITFALLAALIAHIISVFLYW